MNRWFISLTILALLATGCRQPIAGNAGNQSNFGFGQGGIFNRPRVASNNTSIFGRRDTNNTRQIQANTQQEFQEYSQLSQEIQTLNSRLGGFDSDNQQLVTEIANLKQKLQVASDYNNQIKQQLADNNSQLQQMQLERQQFEQQLAQVLQSNQELESREQFASTTGGAPTQLIGGATVRANNSLLQKLSNIQIAGGQARMDGDVIRVEFPSDVLFQPGTYRFRPEQQNTVRNIVTTIRNYFPDQIVGIEAHWDGTPLSSPNDTHHSLTATQALAVFNQLVQLGLPQAQLFTMGMGSNRPRHAAGNAGNISPNRRIEIVIYPERFNAR